MIKTLLCLLFVVLGVNWASAQVMNKVVVNFGHHSSYVGPLDTISGATAYACYSLRACSETTAEAHVNAIELKRTSDSAVKVITVLSNGNLDNASITTFCAATTCSVVQLYEQIGETLNLGGTPGNVSYSASCINSLPCLQESGVTGFFLNSLSTHAQPYTFVSVGERTGAFTTAQTIVSTDDGSNPSRLNWANSANTFHMEGASTISASATDSVWHVFQGVFSDALSASNLNIDCHSTAGSVGIGLSGAAIQVMQDNLSQPMTGNWVESIIFLNGLSSANETAYGKNVQAYWGAGNFGASC